TLFGLLYLRRLGAAVLAVDPSRGGSDGAGVAGAGVGVAGTGGEEALGSRRLFLIGLGSLAAFAAGAAVLSRRFGHTEVVDVARRDAVLPPPRPAAAGLPPTFPADAGAIDGLTPYVIPNESFYRID